MDVDWHGLFAFSMSPLELMVRGSLTYLFLFLVFRSVLQRDVGAVGVADILLLVIVADASQNAMAGEYRSLSDGIVLVSTILVWNVLFDFLAYRFRPLRRLLQARPLCLIRDGRVQHRNLRREFMSEEELRAKLRTHGVRDYGEVLEAYLESDGSVSVIKRESAPDDDQDGSPPRRPV